MALRVSCLHISGSRRRCIMHPDVTAALKVAEQFGKLIAKMDYPAAHALLTQETQKVYSPCDIRWTVEAMTAHMTGAIRLVELPEELIRKDWPDKRPGDIASVLVRLIGDVFVEPVRVVLVEEAGAIRIRHLEWGQPLSPA